MQRIGTMTLLLILSAAPRLWAAPATVEDSDYKVTLSETLPGLDGRLAPQQGATITVTAQDKFSGTGTAFPIPAYAVEHYYLSGDRLDLVCRTTPLTSDTGPRYSLLQLDLSAPADSRQFQPLKRYSLSPDNRNLLALFDGGGKGDPLALLRLSGGAARPAWIYGNGADLFEKALPALAGPLTFHAPVGWSADSGTAAFLVSTGGASPAPGAAAGGVFLAFLELEGDSLRVAAEPVDLSAYGYGKGSVVTDIRCSGGQATLFFNRAGSSDTPTVSFPIPSP